MDISSIDYTQQARSRYTDQFKNNLEFDAIVSTFTDLLNVYQNQYLIFKDRILDIDYQQGSGLDTIGNIVGQSRTLVDFNQDVHFGFDGAYKSDTFGDSTNPLVGSEWFSSLSPSAGSGRILTDEEYRNVIRARIIYNKTTCKTDDFLEILNLLTFTTTNSVDWNQHGNILVNISQDVKGLASYFISKIGVEGNIFPVPLGYRVTANISAA